MREAQTEQITKYITMADVADGCGCRVTCCSSSQVYGVIQRLREEGFEFLELDNKYNTIRKDGAYKVIPCTMKDSKIGIVFELQVTTLASTTVADLFHNVIYKRRAIGLNPTKQERAMVRVIQRLGALIETGNLVSKRPIILTEKLKGINKVAALLLLKGMIETVIRGNHQLANGWEMKTKL